MSYLPLDVFVYYLAIQVPIYNLLNNKLYMNSSERVRALFEGCQQVRAPKHAHC
jgi:hypothetical protein